MQYQKSALREAQDMIKRIEKSKDNAISLDTRTKPRKKSEWEQAEEKVKTKIGAVNFNWIKNNEPLCLKLLTCSQSLISTIKEDPISKAFPALSDFLGIDKYREYSFMVTPAAKAYEGILLRFMICFKETTEKELEDKPLSIGYFYRDNKTGEALAKKHVKKARNKNLISKLYGDWENYRNKLLHFDKDFLVLNPDEAKEIIENIYKSIKLAYKIFLGSPT